MIADQREPLLLTPGPLTTSLSTRKAMLHDRGSRDAAFMDMNARICTRILEIAGAGGTHVCVPLQGSGTFAVEAAIGTLLPRGGKLLVLVNGAYGARMARICEVLGRDFAVLQDPEDAPTHLAGLEAALAADAAITHVAAVYCETTSGILNPLEEIARIASEHHRGLLVDAMSGFGALPLNVQDLPCEAVMASSNKCLEGVPGMGFIIAHEQSLAAATGNAHSLCLDLADQWRFMQRTGQWRFTPPTHVMAALDAALEEHAREGDVEGRGNRYRNNLKVLVDGMRTLGFETLLPDALQAPIIVTFHTPADPNFDFATFYDQLRQRNYVIYPGKLTKIDSFRIGCIGQVGEEEMHGLISAVRETLSEMRVTYCGRA